MPTLARHLDITLPKEQAFEIDGTPFTGPLSIHKLVMNKQGDKLSLHWKALDSEGKMKIWLSTTNHFKEGERDNYFLLGEVAAKAQKAEFDLSKLPSRLYKVVLEGEHNTLNGWLVDSKR